MQALTNHRDMVDFLVEGKHLPVDIRTGATQITPLLAVVTRRCSWDVDGAYTSTSRCRLEQPAQRCDRRYSEGHDDGLPKASAVHTSAKLHCYASPFAWLNMSQGNDAL